MSGEPASKKGILQRLFPPLHIKAPINVIVVIAIAATVAYFIRTAKHESDQTGTVPGYAIESEEGGPPLPFEPAEEHPLNPEERKTPATTYKSLDMRSQNTPRGEAPSMSAISTERSKSTSMTVYVKTLETAIGDAEKAVQEDGGEITRSEASGNTYYMTVQLPFDRLNKLKEKLKRIGEVEEGTVSLDAEGDGEISIRIVETEVRHY